ncbi:hypothetical protein PR048_016477 [Dryococelus australis]|uniref:Gag protein n=1 Tax=Dryococelus australis TaxID=614101 RepID=A0ABQ9HK99_9NEOP|nr:hypothetical protein PR048_016477 [Dryococelus australis]
MGKRRDICRNGNNEAVPPANRPATEHPPLPPTALLRNTHPSRQLPRYGTPTPPANRPTTEHPHLHPTAPLRNTHPSHQPPRFGTPPRDQRSEPLPISRASDTVINGILGGLGKFTCLAKPITFREAVELALSIIEADRCALDETPQPCKSAFRVDIKPTTCYFCHEIGQKQSQCSKKRDSCFACGGKQYLADDFQKSSSNKNDEQLN